MAWSKKQIILAIVMVITGSINTLSAKWVDLIPAENRQGDVVKFNHPFFQADAMFVGEMLCMLTFYIQLAVLRGPCKRRYGSELQPESHKVPEFPRLIFFLPAMCDMTATSMMYLGLTLTYASSFQMLRGAVIVFTGLLSVAFLGRRLHPHHWLGIAAVITGLVIVGASDFLTDDEEAWDTYGIITGDLLIVMAQIVTATQMVIEEKFITKYNIPPLLAVGWEGTYGFVVLSLLMIPMYWLYVGKLSGNERGVLEDAIDAAVQLSNSSLLVFALFLNIISIAFFNFAGVSVTKELSATTRMVLDSVRTLTIWLFSLAVKWQKFQYLQPIGFLVLMVGMMLYNDILIMPALRRRGYCSSPLQTDIEPATGHEDEVDSVPNYGATKNKVDPM